LHLCLAFNLHCTTLQQLRESHYKQTTAAAAAAADKELPTHFLPNLLFLPKKDGPGKTPIYLFAALFTLLPHIRRSPHAATSPASLVSSLAAIHGPVHSAAAIMANSYVRLASRSRDSPPSTRLGSTRPNLIHCLPASRWNSC
jgi:hypothetical protein